VAGVRRLGAIVFADMVGYSALSQRDESLALRLVAESGEVLRSLLDGHHGREVKSMGDGFLLEFESALDATECAIAYQRTLFERNRQRPESERVEMRIGVHLGDVVHQGSDVVGDTVNIAARIEPLAEASGICLTGPVVEQVANKIPYGCTRLEHAVLKNIETPVAVYGLDLPWHAPPAARVTPWTDRVSELASLRTAIDDARRGIGSVVAVAGESGIGKTRLAEEAIRHATRAGFRVLRGRGFEDEMRAPYAVWQEAARSFFRDAPTVLAYKVLEDSASEVTELVPELLERFGPKTPGASLEPAAARLRFLEGITRFFQNLARESPLLLLLDDLQWADSGSLGLLEYFAPRIREDRIVALLTYRDIEVEAGGALSKALSNLNRVRCLRQVPLKRLAAEPTTDLIGAILATKRPPEELARLVAQKTGGNPYFVEELLRSLIEEDVLVRTPDGWDRKSGAKIEMPSTVREVVRRRVQRVGSEGEQLLSVASVFGGEFDFDLLRQTSGIEEQRLLLLFE
jgi:class 3 adenylate cyclase